MPKKKLPTSRKSSIPTEQRAYMEYVYQGAAAICKKHGIVGPRDLTHPNETEAPAKLTRAGKVKIAGPPKVVAASGDLVEWVERNRSEYAKVTALIRAIALAYPDCSIREIRAALPDLNPSTVGIQVGRARK